MSLARLGHRFLPDPPVPGPLLVVLHGRGDSMDGFSWLPGALRLDGLGYLFLNAPDDYYGGFSWYDLPPNQAPGVLRSRGLLIGLLDDLVVRGWDSRQIVLFGFSQGCLMAIDVGLRYPRRLGGVCGVSGYTIFPEKAALEATAHARAMPWLITHGTYDGVLPIGPSREHAAMLVAAGIPIEWQEYPKDHTIDLDVELPRIRAWLATRLVEMRVGLG